MIDALHFPHLLQVDTLSINHNWSNAFNLGGMWEHLQEELAAVRRALSGFDFGDSKTPGAGAGGGGGSSKESSGSGTEFVPDDDQLQLVLRANAGIDYAGFWRFLQFNLQRQCDRLRSQLAALRDAVSDGKSGKNGKDGVATTQSAQVASAVLVSSRSSVGSCDLSASCTAACPGDQYCSARLATRPRRAP